MSGYTNYIISFKINGRMVIPAPNEEDAMEWFDRMTAEQIVKDAEDLDIELTELER